VVDEATGQPVSSVDFWLLEGAEEPRGNVYSEHGPPRDVRTTDGLGRMQFADLPPGVYELSPRPIQPQSAGPGFQLPADDLGWIPAATALFVPAGVRGERMDVVLSVRSGVYLEGGIAVDQMPQAGAEGSRISVCGVLPDGRFACAW
jgi:hypothetical protein